MIPHIEFVYSWIYDNGRRENKLLQEKLKEQGDTYPSSEEIQKKMKECENNWRKEEKEILEKLAKIMALSWKEEKIKCYIMGRGKSISDPLTVTLSNKGEQFIDTLTHELIHQLQLQNVSRIKKWWEQVNEKYSKEPKLTKNHILLHAVHTKLLKEIYNEERLKKNIVKSNDSPDYRLSWKIVSQEGYDNIIKKYLEILQ